MRKQALNRNKPSFTPYTYDLNIYRGCAHRCCYCYAIYYHKFLDDQNFYENIYYKSNIAKSLTRLFQKKTSPISLLELELFVTEFFLKHGVSIYLSTKSELILRDVDLLAKLSKNTPISLCVSITTFDEELRKKLEPGVPPPNVRFDVLKKLKNQTNALVGVHLMPIIPFITDNLENIEKIFLLAKENNLDFVICSPLNLIGETKKQFLNFIIDNFPENYEKIKNLYPNSKKLSEYIKNIKREIYLIKKKIGFKNKYIKDYLTKKENFVLHHLNKNLNHQFSQ